jgi:3-oxoacyl-(acyl-carrier-protein) synthase
MIDPLVIVGMSRVDSSTENTQPVATAEHSVWVYTIPQDATDLAYESIAKIPDNVRNSVHTVITCNSADDAYARQRCIVKNIGDRIRPRDVLGALGVNLVMALNENLPNMQNMFKAEAACATGLVALELAEMIARTKNVVVLLAGVDKSTSPFFLNMFRNVGALAASPDQHYVAFDSRRCGFAMGEGAGLLAVTTQSHAQELDLSVIATVDAINTRTMVTHPTDPSNPELIEQLVRETIQTSGRNLAEFAYWDAHGTATPVGDELEYNIFAKVFENHDLAISSFKSRVGHCMSASALVEMINGIENLQQQTITYNYNLTDKFVNDDRIITQPVHTTKRTFVKTSFGFGGRNAAAVITVT